MPFPARQDAPGKSSAPPEDLRGFAGQGSAVPQEGGAASSPTEEPKEGPLRSGEDTIRAREAVVGCRTKLYSSWFCPFAQRAWIALEELRVPYQWVEIDPYRPGSSVNTKTALTLDEKRAKYPDFVSTSPRGLIPALSHRRGTEATIEPLVSGGGGQDTDRVCESLILCEYVDERFGARGDEGGDHGGNSGLSLLPPLSRPGERARVRYWCSFAGEKVIPPFYKLLAAREDGPARDAAQGAFLDGLLAFARGMEQPLPPQPQRKGGNMDGGGGGGGHASGGGPFFLGGAFGLADLAVAPWVQRAICVFPAYERCDLGGDAESGVGGGRFCLGGCLGGGGGDALGRLLWQLDRGSSARVWPAAAEGTSEGTPEAGAGAVAVSGPEDVDMDPDWKRLCVWYAAVRARPSFARTVVDSDRLIRSYSGYANGSATSDAAKKYTPAAQAIPRKQKRSGSVTELARSVTELAD